MFHVLPLKSQFNLERQNNVGSIHQQQIGQSVNYWSIDKIFEPPTPTFVDKETRDRSGNRRSSAARPYFLSIMKFLASLLVLLASTSIVQAQGAEYSEYGDYQDYQEYADDYGQQDNLYADYAQRQQVKATGGGGWVQKWQAVKHDDPFHSHNCPAPL